MSSGVKANGTDLDTYGLRLSTISGPGHLGLAPYKKIIDSQNLPENIRIQEEKTITVRMFGIYATKSQLASAITNFKSAISANLVMLWEIAAHGIAEYCLIKNGIQVDIIDTGAEVIFNLTVTTEP